MTDRNEIDLRDNKEIESNDSSYRDALPEDLDITRAKAAYLLPSMTRRRYYAAFAWIMAVISGTLWATRGQAVFVNRGFLIFAVACAVGGIALWFTGWPLRVREIEAISKATASVSFPIGHVAAQLGWQGVRSRPTWRVLLYSAENPPRDRAVVLVDGVQGGVVYSFEEPNPEDWSQFADAK